MPRGRPRKDPFADLPKDYLDAAERMSADELKAELITVTSNESENQKHKSEDVHLKEMKESYDSAGAKYKEATKANKSKTALLLRMLGDKGAI